MTAAPGEQIASPWKDPLFAQNWNSADAQEALLTFPRQIAPAVVAASDATIGSVIEIGSGPGAFLASFLDAFPEAHGTATDASPAMLDLGRENLARFGDRVDFRIADMTALEDADLPHGVDALITSRATHHLDASGIAAFYASAARLLAPGGWIFNLDHVHVPEPWLKRMKATRKRFLARSESKPRPSASESHVHLGTSPTTDQHLSAMREAGMSSTLVWQAFRTVLVAARREP